MVAQKANMQALKLRKNHSLLFSDIKQIKFSNSNKVNCFWPFYVSVLAIAGALFIQIVHRYSGLSQNRLEECLHI